LLSESCSPDQFENIKTFAVYETGMTCACMINIARANVTQMAA